MKTKELDFTRLAVARPKKETLARLEGSDDQ
jgi:hypothetical protein